MPAGCPPPQRRPSVYVYPLPAHLTEESLYANLTANDHDFHFSGELELTRVARSLQKPRSQPARRALSAARRRMIV